MLSQVLELSLGMQVRQPHGPKKSILTRLQLPFLSEDLMQCGAFFRLFPISFAFDPAAVIT